MGNELKMKEEFLDQALNDLAFRKRLLEILFSDFICPKCLKRLQDKMKKCQEAGHV